MQIVKIKDLSKLDDIKSLYIEAFSSGISQQLIEDEELDNYLRALLTTGYALVMLENEKTIGALLSCPLIHDKLLPDEIIRKYTLKSGIYIAEMMVDENFRGKGIGQKLLIEFMTTVDRSYYKDVFIRVWDKNTPALSLYQKMGFNQVATVSQTKTSVDGNGNFVMLKIYLHQKLK